MMKEKIMSLEEVSKKHNIPPSILRAVGVYHYKDDRSDKEYEVFLSVVNKRIVYHTTWGKTGSRRQGEKEFQNFEEMDKVVRQKVAKGYRPYFNDRCFFKVEIHDGMLIWIRRSEIIIKEDIKEDIIVGPDDDFASDFMEALRKL